MQKIGHRLKKYGIIAVFLLFILYLIAFQSFAKENFEMKLGTSSMTADDFVFQSTDPILFKGKLQKETTYEVSYDGPLQIAVYSTDQGVVILEGGQKASMSGAVGGFFILGSPEAYADGGAGCFRIAENGKVSLRYSLVKQETMVHMTVE